MRNGKRRTFLPNRAPDAAVRMPECDVPAEAVESLLPRSALADRPPDLPELTEPDVVRHFVNLPTQNMSVDGNFYPLGSCTMKYNPKRNEAAGLAGGPGRAASLPAERDDPGHASLLHSLQEMLAEIAGLDAVSLQPAAGAHGEMTALFVAAAFLRDTGQNRDVVLIPDGAARNESGECGDGRIQDARGQEHRRRTG